MIVSRIAYRYAKSLFTQSKESKSLDKVKGDMETVFNAIENSNELEVFLKSPIINAEKKKAVLDKLFTSKVSKDTAALINLLVTKGRESELASVATGFLRLYQQENDQQTATLTTAVQLTAGLKKDFEKLANDLSGKKVDLVEQVDEELIGGYVLRFDDRQIDASIKTKLNKVKQQLFS